jgi:hypothetical protein
VRVATHAGALLVFLAAEAVLFRGAVGVDLRVAAPIQVLPGVEEGPAKADLSFVVWLVARNARTLLRDPLRLFDAEPCAPAADALALGESGLTLGLLAAPAWLATGDPVATFDLLSLALPLLAAFAMYALVLAWSGSAVAGVAAGLAYAFHAAKQSDVIHPYLGDSAATIVALLCFERWLARGRWRDALGLALCAVLQIGGSPYLLVSAILVGLPLAAALAFQRGVRRVRPAQVAALGAIVLAAAWLVFAPYQAQRSAGALEATGFPGYHARGSFAPGGLFFAGFGVWALVAAALVLPRRRALAIDADPRAGLVVGALLCWWAATGGGAVDALAAFVRGEPPPALLLPNLWAGIVWLVPALELVRVPGTVQAGAHLALCALAGLGAAALLRSLPKSTAPFAGAACVAWIFVETLRPPGLGLEPRFGYRWVAMRPAQEILDFFAELERRGDAGPIFELPTHFFGAPRGVLLSAYHHRRTSHCWSSFVPPQVREAQRRGVRLPNRRDLRALRALGFRTVVVYGSPYVARFEAFARTPAGARVLRPVHRSEGLAAFALL